MKREDITLQMLMEALSYNQETGLFSWTEKGPFTWRNRPAGTIDQQGYVRIAFKRVGYKAHQLAYAFVNGHFAQNGMHIDHLNGVTNDNRIANLRLCTAKQNIENSKKNKSNTSGFKGVSKSGSMYRAHITHNRRQLHLGNFMSPEEAHAAYVLAASSLGWQVHRTF